MAPMIVVAFFVLVAIALGFAWLGWHAARRWGPRALIPIWLAAALAYGAWNSWFTPSARGGTVESLMARAPWILPLFFAIGLLAFGMEALSLRKSLRHANTGLNSRIVLRAVGGFFGGMGIILLLALGWDIIAVVRA